MCAGLGCPKKDSCKRHVAVPNEYRQSFFAKTPLKEDNTCDHYWEVQVLTKDKLRDLTEPRECPICSKAFFTGHCTGCGYEEVPT